MRLETLRETGNRKETIVFRLIAGGPLLLFGTMHLVGAAPMRPILDAANIPLPGLNAIVAPIFQILAGLSLLSGGLARLGGLLSVPLMLVALYTHWVADWPDEPSPLIAVAVLLSALYVVWRGGGAWSLDAGVDGRRLRPPPGDSWDTRQRVGAARD